jgi:hypothetical protein
MGNTAFKSSAVILLLSAVGFGQAVSPRARFDVISVKRNVSGAMNEVTPPLQHGKLRFTNVTVQGIMSLAFLPA